MQPDFQIERIYDVIHEEQPEDRLQILIDRLWPRGVSKAAVRIDRWEKDLAPSTELRKWFHAQDTEAAAVLEEFQQKYLQELKENQAAVESFLEFVRASATKHLLLLTATKDLKTGHAAILKTFLKKQKI